MKITKKYGNTIYGDNTISQTITYHFDKIKDLHEFWKDNQDAEQTGGWTAHLDRMTIEHSQFVDAEQYLNDFAEFCEGEEEDDYEMSSVELKTQRDLQELAREMFPKKGEEE